MRLAVKDMDIFTGDTLVGIINLKDAQKFDLHALDRIKVKKGRKTETVVVDIAQSDIVPAGRIGVFEELIKSLHLKSGDHVEILPDKKPKSLEYIKKKLNGEKLGRKEIEQIVWDIVHNKLSHIELTYFVAACYTNALTFKETELLTEAMAKEGEKLHLKSKVVMDKHCIGGVAGNRTTMIVVPIIAAAGLKIPKTSSRSITSPAGTADTMEVLANVTVSLKRMKRIVEKTNGCMVWGGALRLAPADDKIIKVEKPLAIDAKSQLLASVMSKKLSVSATHLLIDIPWGEGSKIESKRYALALKRNFEQVGRRLGMKVKVALTDGRQPIGNGIGPLLEARDVMWVLKSDKRMPIDLYKKSVQLAGMMLELAGKTKQGEAMARRLVESGAAYKKMAQIICAQGKKTLEPSKLRLGRFQKDIIAQRKGILTTLHNDHISRVARTAGAPVDKAAGIYLLKHVGDRVKKGDVIYTIYAESDFKLTYALAVAKELDFGVHIR